MRNAGRAARVLGLVIGLACWHADAAANRSVTDDRGVRIELAQPARRIVAAAPHLAELAAAAGAGNRLVGVVRYSTYPAALARLPQVGDAVGLDLERILALQPDLVLAWKSGNRAADIARLESLGVRVFASEPAVLDDVARTLREIGVLAGTEAAAESAARDFEQELARLTAAARGRTAVPVFVQIWDQPLMTVNRHHLISDVLRRCAGRNVFADLPSLAGSVSIESVIAADPQVIIATGLRERFDPLRYWARAPDLRAVAAGRVHVVDPDLLTRATPRILAGVRAVCGWLAAPD